MFFYRSGFECLVIKHYHIFSSFLYLSWFKNDNADWLRKVGIFVQIVLTEYFNGKYLQYKQTIVTRLINCTFVLYIRILMLKQTLGLINAFFRKCSGVLL